MWILSENETSLWCNEHGIALNEDGLPDRSDASSKFVIPQDAQKRVHLVCDQMRAFSVEPLLLVWFHDWAVWPSGQRMHVFDRFRMSYGEARPLGQVPGHVFDKDEIEDAVSFVTLGVLFLWDCYVIAPSSCTSPMTNTASRKARMAR
jgi:hypothetical protein